ncbi:MAG: hypothetical protein GY714_23405, partial [Desulfobacterales bacterium]|nr:hypothetical protein [Desulfobacterales bacterium]
MIGKKFRLARCLNYGGKLHKEYIKQYGVILLDDWFEKVLKIPFDRQPRWSTYSYEEMMCIWYSVKMYITTKEEYIVKYKRCDRCGDVLYYIEENVFEDEEDRMYYEYYLDMIDQNPDRDRLLSRVLYHSNSLISEVIIDGE